MIQWPMPKTLKAFRGFLGLTGYYRKFVAGYAKVSHPLTQLLKKHGFRWNEEATLAFAALKKAMTAIPTLALLGFTKISMVEANASHAELGAVLSQDNHPIAFFNQNLGPRAKHKSVYEKELMAIVLSVLKWRHYLLGRKFTIKTDHQSFKFLMEQREVGPEYQRWVSKLLGYTFDINYRYGVSNVVGNALSRQGKDETELNVVTATSTFAWAEWLPQQDPFIQQLTHAVHEGS